MKRSRFSDEQIIGLLKEQEAGAATADVWRRHGISGATFYKWKAKFGGLEVTEAKRLRTLEWENAKLKKLLAEAMLDIALLKDIPSKKWCVNRRPKRTPFPAFIDPRRRPARSLRRSGGRHRGPALLHTRFLNRQLSLPVSTMSQ
jgi:putative transposase